MLKQASRRRSRGAGLVELLLGVALGLFIVAGGVAMLVGFTDENRRLLLETRLMQDLRAASDLITRDIRRAGYWARADRSVWVTGSSTAPPQNAYSAVSASPCASDSGWSRTTTAASDALCFSIAGDTDDSVTGSEHYGYELDGGVIYAVLAGQDRQALTDAKALHVDSLVITPSSQLVDASSFCSHTCTGSGCPTVVVREFEVLIKASVPGNTAISRFLRSDVRVRNDYYGGSCPTS